MPFKVPLSRLDCTSLNLGEAFYDILSTTYLMSEEELIENSYPRPTEETGVAQINLKEVAPPITAVGTKGTLQFRDSCVQILANISLLMCSYEACML